MRPVIVVAIAQLAACRDAPEPGAPVSDVDRAGVALPAALEVAPPPPLGVDSLPAPDAAPPPLGVDSLPAPDAAAPPLDVDSLPAPDAAVPRPGCEPRPIPRSTVTCGEPGAEIVERARKLIASVSADDPSWEPRPRFGCELARGWLMHAEFSPSPDFLAGEPVACPAAAGDCGVAAVWLLPPRGAARLLRGTSLGESLDIDGDGRAESVTYTASAMTIWFDAGRKPVTTRARGTWQPWGRGHVLTELDGDPSRGFVAETARAFRVSPAGVKEAKDVVAALWQNSVAARCPVADVIAPRDPRIPPLPPSPSNPRHGCAGPGHDLEARLTAQVMTAITDRVRARAMLIAEGAPVFEWSCNQRHVAAIVTYCEGDAAEACAAEKGSWLHEIWVRRGDAMRLVERNTSGSVLMEWAVNDSLGIVRHADLDGDGELDPILAHVQCEGGAGSCDHHYKALVRGAVVAIASLTIEKGQDTTPRTLRIPGRRADAVVLPATQFNGEPDSRNIHTARAWSLVGGRMRPVTGPLERQLLRDAR